MYRLFRQYFVLVTLAVAGLLLRLLFFEQSPPRLTQDEMSLGYNAYSIAKTGSDEHGSFFPLTFQAFGDNKMPGYIYASAPFVAFSGMNVWSIKIPSLIAGIALIFIVYAIGSEAVSPRVGILAAAVMALFPWPILFSRMALESHLALAYYALGILALLKFYKRPTIYLGIVSGVSLAAAYYTYISFRVLVPGLVIWFTLLVFRTKIWKARIHLLPLVLVGLLFLPWIFERTDAAVRMSQVSQTVDEGVLAATQQSNNFCFMRNPQVLGRWCRYVYVLPLERAIKSIEYYIQFYMPDFLFINGDVMAYLQVPGQGMFYLVSLPFYVWGLVELIRNNSFQAKLLVGAFVLAAIPGAIVGPPQSVRASSLVLLVALIIAMGTDAAWRRVKFKKEIFLSAITFLVFISMARFLTEYYFIYPSRNAEAWYGIPTEVATLVKNQEHLFDHIYVDEQYSNPYIFLAFYNAWNPEWYRQSVQLPETDAYGFRHPIAVGKYQFGTEPVTTFLCDPEQKYGRTLFISPRKEKWQPTMTFYDYSGVHPQAFVFDTAETRERLKQAKLFETACPEQLSEAD